MYVFYCDVLFSVFQVPEHFPSKRPDVRGERGGNRPNSPRHTERGESKYLDFGRTSFMDQ